MNSLTPLQLPWRWIFPPTVTEFGTWVDILAWGLIRGPAHRKKRVGYWALIETWLQHSWLMTSRDADAEGRELMRPRPTLPAITWKSRIGISM